MTGVQTCALPIYFYKLLMWPTSYWFSSRSIINITFSFTNNHLPHQQFVKILVKKFVSLTLLKNFLALLLPLQLTNIYIYIYIYYLWDYFLSETVLLCGSEIPLKIRFNRKKNWVQSGKNIYSTSLKMFTKYDTLLLIYVFKK